ncbi:hypothetical protein EG329_005186 [Mollisiaceae sp. DMI_Dod_QoI]|nr:hypothetical protein EG329_005186 [Helotiales sp. DMI_Dod_QoI]
MVSDTMSAIEKDRLEREARAFRLWDTTSQFFPSSIRQARVSQYTELAKKYSHPTGNWLAIADNRVLRNTGKSGLTPLLPLDVNQLLTEATERQYARHVELEIYQRRRLIGFTAAEMQTLEALAGLEKSSMNYHLNTPVHPVFERRWWMSQRDLPKHRALIPILGDHDGPWLDALFKGPITPLPALKPEDIDKYWQISERAPAERNTDSEFFDLQKRLKSLAGWIRIGFMNTRTHNVCGMGEDGYLSGLTVLEEEFLPHRIQMLIAVEMLQPLLRQDLTDAERMVTQLYIAHVMMLGGEADSIHKVDNARGGPGLPTMGVYKTNWFHQDHKQRLAGTLSKDQEYRMPSSAAASNRAKYNDYYPVPVSWVYSMFQQNTWDIVVRKIGSIAQMGPLTVGTRLLTQQGPTPDWFSVITADDTIDLSCAPYFVPDGSDSVATQKFYQAMEAERIYERTGMDPAVRRKLRASRNTSRTATYGPMQNPITFHPYDPLPDDEEIPPDDFRCPRWNEIVQYLFKNRNPLELALDTMSTLPWNVFYKYIRERGGIQISSLEMWHFLGVADRRKELFLFDPYPGPGLVTRIEAGWPPGVIFAYKNIPEPKIIPSAFDKDGIMMLIRSDGVREFLYENMRLRTLRDMDIDTFRLALQHLRNFPIDSDTFRDLIIQCVRETWDFNDEFTLGPKGIIRFTYDMTKLIHKLASDFAKARIKEIEKRKNEVETEWRNKQLQGI